MSSFFVRGIDLISDPTVSTNSSAGQDGAGQLRLLGGTQPFADDAIIEFITQGETASGELDGGSSFVGIRVYENLAAYEAGIVTHNYVPQNPGQSAGIQSDASGLGDNYVRFNANVLVPRTESGAHDPSAPSLGTILVAPGTDAGDNIGSLVLDRNTDQDFDNDGTIGSQQNEDGNGKFFVGNDVPCFTCGSLIETPGGLIEARHLREGDKVFTQDNGVQKIIWAGSRTLSGDNLGLKPQFHPVRIKADALGNGMPERDMTVSPNHRVLVSRPENSLYFGDHEVLVAAKHLVDGKGIVGVETRQVTYVHFMFEQHQIVKSDGAWTESFQPGEQSLNSIGRDQRDEINALFPELADQGGIEAYQTARRTLKRHEARLLHG